MDIGIWTFVKDKVPKLDTIPKVIPLTEGEVRPLMMTLHIEAWFPPFI